MELTRTPKLFHKCDKLSRKCIKLANLYPQLSEICLYISCICVNIITNDDLDFKNMYSEYMKCLNVYTYITSEVLV